MSFISSAELVILRKMYPEGCRVSLEEWLMNRMQNCTLVILGL